MNDVIQHYLRTYAKGRIDYFTEPRNLFMPFTSETDEEKHEHQFNELKQIQRDFHEYVSVLINAIDENIEFLNKPFKINIIHNKQIQKIKSDLSFMKKSILRNEQHINFDTNILLGMLPTGNKNNYTLSKEEIKSLKDDNIPQEYELILFGGEPGDIYSFPQEPLFSLIDSFINLCRITMRLCLIQQQIQDLYFEEDFDPEKRKEILFLKNFINDKMSDIQEELYTYNMKLESISDSQIQFFFKQEHNNNMLEREIEIRDNLKKTKALKPGICLTEIEKVLMDANIRKKDIHYASIKKRLSQWNTYIKTDGKKGSEPLDGYDFARHRTPSYFKNWVIETFLPDYRARLRKQAGDAMKHAVYGHQITQ